MSQTQSGQLVAGIFLGDENAEVSRPKQQKPSPNQHGAAFGAAAIALDGTLKNKPTRFPGNEMGKLTHDACRVNARFSRPGGWTLHGSCFRQTLSGLASFRIDPMELG